MRSEDRRDNEALYNKMTIEEMMVNFTEPQITDPIQVKSEIIELIILGLASILCYFSYKIIPEQPDLHYMKLGLVLISISHVFKIILVLSTPLRLIK